MGTVSDRWSVYSSEKENKNGTALQYYARKEGVSPGPNTDIEKSELGGGNGKITADNSVLSKPPQSSILHEKILQSQILDNSDQWL